MLLHREQMDEMARNGCQMPGCTHTSHEPVVFIHSRCHMNGQAEASYYENDQLHVACGKCNKYIVDIAIKEPKNIRRCHIQAPLEIGYREGSGILKIICNECKALLVELEVA